MTDNDTMHVIIRDYIFNHPIVIPLHPSHQRKAEKIIEIVKNVLQSEENCVVNEIYNGG